ncbi:hypothetical protein ABIA54_004186 [Pseudomonas sp. EB276 TE3739]|nr:hypothetical protein [Pseudomonas koreensis]
MNLQIFRRPTDPTHLQIQPSKFGLVRFYFIT